MKECYRCFTVWYNHLYMVWESGSHGQAAAIFQCYGNARTYRYETWISKGAINVVSPTKSYVVPFINTWRIRWLFRERWYSVCDGIKYEPICKPRYPQKVKSNMFIWQRKRNLPISWKNINTFHAAKSEIRAENIATSSQWTNLFRPKIAFIINYQRGSEFCGAPWDMQSYLSCKTPYTVDYR